MRPRSLVWVLVGLSAACGGTKTEDAPSRTLVTISGNLVSHPLNGSSVDFTELQILVANPATLILSPDSPPLAKGALSAAECSATLCSWSLLNVDITDATSGLLAGVVDSRATPAWFPTYTGIASARTVVASQVAAAPITDTVASALTVEAVQTIASVTGVPLADLQTRGFLMGTIVGKLSEATTASNNIPPPIAGATVTTDAGPSEVSIFYLNADYTGLGDSTSSNGTFIAVPTKTSVGTATLVTNFAVTGPSSDASHAWTGKSLAGMAAQKALIVAFPADS